MTHLFLVLHLDGVLLYLHHQVLRNGGRPDQLRLQVSQFLLHDGHLGGGKGQLLETVHVAGLQHHDLISLLAKQRLEGVNQLQVGGRRHVVVTSQDVKEPVSTQLVKCRWWLLCMCHIVGRKSV